MVATPGRFIDHLQQVGASLPRSPAWQSILPWLTALLTGTLVSNAALMCWYNNCPGKHGKHRVQQASTLLTLKSLHWLHPVVFITRQGPCRSIWGHSRPFYADPPCSLLQSLL